jgi:signal peptidase II
MIYTIFVVALLILDQIVKYFIDSKFFEGQTLPIIQDFFHLTYVKNRGVAFGIFQGKIVIITIVSLAAVAGIVWYVRKYEKNSSRLSHYAYALIVAGALGNIIDRVIRGYVVDMMDFRGIWSYIFNMADVYINIGVALMLLDYILQEKRKKEEEKLK